MTLLQTEDELQGNWMTNDPELSEKISSEDDQGVD